MTRSLHVTNLGPLRRLAPTQDSCSSELLQHLFPVAAKTNTNLAAHGRGQRKNVRPKTSVELYVVKGFLNEYTHKLCNWGRGAQTQHKATHAHTLVPTDNNTAGGSERGVGAKDWRAQETLPAHKHKTRKDGETGRRQPRSSEKGKSPQRTRQL